MMDVDVAGQVTTLKRLYHVQPVQHLPVTDRYSWCPMVSAKSKHEIVLPEEIYVSAGSPVGFLAVVTC